MNNADFSYLLQCEKPKLFVHGANDIYGAVDKLKGLVASLPSENKLVVVEEADHFFVGKLDQVDAAITNWMKREDFGSGKTKLKSKRDSSRKQRSIAQKSKRDSSLRKRHVSDRIGIFDRRSERERKNVGLLRSE